jgi:hypothetical protein
MASKEGPYRPEVEGSDGDGDHDPGDSEAGYIHGHLLDAEVGLYAEFGRNSGRYSLILAS